MTRVLAALTVVFGALVCVSSAHASVCHVVGTAPYSRPDQDCTPGSYSFLTEAQVCVTKDRADLTAATRRLVLTRYGLPAWTGLSGELDHRVPVFLGGRTNAGNVWPEPGPRPNLKDRLEWLVRYRICVLGNMRVAYARHIFLGSWVLYWRRYVLRA